MTMRKAPHRLEVNVSIGGYQINNLRYADDVVAIAGSMKELQELVDRFDFSFFRSFPTTAFPQDPFAPCLSSPHRARLRHVRARTLRLYPFSLPLLFSLHPSLLSPHPPPLFPPLLFSSCPPPPSASPFPLFSSLSHLPPTFLPFRFPSSSLSFSLLPSPSSASPLPSSSHLPLSSPPLLISLLPSLLSPLFLSLFSSPSYPLSPLLSFFPSPSYPLSPLFLLLFSSPSYLLSPLLSLFSSPSYPLPLLIYLIPSLLFLSSSPLPLPPTFSPLPLLLPSLSPLPLLLPLPPSSPPPTLSLLSPLPSSPSFLLPKDSLSKWLRSILRFRVTDLLGDAVVCFGIQTSRELPFPLSLLIYPSIHPSLPPYPSLAPTFCSSLIFLSVYSLFPFASSGCKGGTPRLSFSVRCSATGVRVPSRGPSRHGRPSTHFPSLSLSPLDSPTPAFHPGSETGCYFFFSSTPLKISCRLHDPAQQFLPGTRHHERISAVADTTSKNHLIRGQHL
ncbi:hypothetical protein C7M84_010547 [Penaeus vannamei]|uniref:Reverse transcriptase domain-containing protein n=1 Tax=Penaeus vannamei TaxID=6689 RepID=A0A423T3S7_PENVA|nr:hypothetical protein C7M84_010547 [Penaeus vannamei]